MANLNFPIQPVQLSMDSLRGFGNAGNYTYKNSLNPLTQAASMVNQNAPYEKMSLMEHSAEPNFVSKGNPCLPMYDIMRYGTAKPEDFDALPRGWNNALGDVPVMGKPLTNLQGLPGYPNVPSTIPVPTNAGLF